MKTFRKTYIEITNQCNLSCDFCPKTSRLPGFMDRTLFEEILTKLQGHSHQLFFHVMGEPLLHPDLGLFLDLADANGYRVNLTTNGMLIGKAAERLSGKPALRQVSFSLHSFDANTHADSMDCYLDRIFDYTRKAIQAGGPLVCLRLWNLSEAGENEANHYVLHRIQMEFGLEKGIEQKLTPCKGLKIAPNVFLNQAARFSWPDAAGEDLGSGGFCYGLRDQIAILVDGTVVPCCLDREGTIRLGNIQESSLEELFNSPRAQALYQGFSGRTAAEDLCRRCGYRTRFGT